MRVELLTAALGGAHGEVVQALRQELPGVALPVHERLPAPGPDAPPGLVLTLGVQALRLAAERARQPAWRGVPVLAGLLPQAAFEPLAAELPRGSSAVWLDQPLDRLLALTREAFAPDRRVGVLLGPTSALQEDWLDRAARRLGLQLVKSAPIGRSADIYPALSEVLNASDVLLALPDPLVFNTDTLQHILMATYRQRVPVLSYAASHVRAGATLALYTSPVQVAQQMAQAVRAARAGAPLPTPAWAQDFTLAANEQVARSLGRSLPVASQLAAALRRLEGMR